MIKFLIGSGSMNMAMSPFFTILRYLEYVFYKLDDATLLIVSITLIFPCCGVGLFTTISNECFYAEETCLI